MQALRSVTAVFCIACICAEVLAQLAGEGWPRQCIKALTGLYILVVLVHALPSLRAEAGAFTVPETTVPDFGTAEQSILLQTQSQLEQTLAAQCREETGVQPVLQVTLRQSGTEVSAAQVEVTLPAEASAQDRERVAAFLRQALGVEPQFAGGEGGT